MQNIIKQIYLHGNCVNNPIDNPSKPSNNGNKQQSQSQHGQAQNHSRHEQHGHILDNHPVQQLQHR